MFYNYSKNIQKITFSSFANNLRSFNEKTIKRFLPTVQVIQNLLHLYLEVVAYDIMQIKILAIYYPYWRFKKNSSATEKTCYNYIVAILT